MKFWCLFLMIAAPVAAMALDNPDADFYNKAIQSGLSEVDTSLLAQQRGKSPQVLAFAAMMVKDHNTANLALREIATVNHVDLPVSPSAAQASKKNALSALSGDEFDRAYIEAQILAHRDAIALFKVESESGDDKDAREFAAQTLPTLQSHLAKLMAMPMIPPAASAPAP